MQNTFSLLFYPKRNDIDNDGNTPIYLRITVNGKRSEISINRKIPLNKWNSIAGKIKGTTSDVRELNQYMDSIKYRVQSIYNNLIREGRPITPITIKNRFLGKDVKVKMILQIFQQHNDKVEKLVGKDFAAGTLERYKTARKHLKNYIIKEYKVEDIPVTDVNHEFITGFEFYLKTTRNCAHNSAIKYVTNFKKIIRIAYANDWIDKDPFVHWKGKLKIVDREFLTEKELQTLVEKEFGVQRLNQVKDIFVFCCFTGLAYADVKKLNRSDISIGADGEEWIKTKRSKTDTRSNIPILPIAKAIIEKYKDNELLKEKDLVLPVLSNQKMNAYIKEIATLAGITKNLTFHLARHTFATTVTLTNGVPIESVSKMLGHTNLKTTQHYAKILDMKVSKDMAILRAKFK